MFKTTVKIFIYFENVDVYFEKFLGGFDRIPLQYFGTNPLINQTGLSKLYFLSDLKRRSLGGTN